MMHKSISDTLLSPWIIGVISTALELKMFSILSGKKLSLEEISFECKSVPDRMKILLDACVSLGLVDCENRKYMNTHFSYVYFNATQPLYVGDFVHLLKDESSKWVHLPEIIQGQDNIKSDEAYIRSDYQTFIRAMNNIGKLGEAEALKTSVDLSGCRQMVDAGGGSGLYSITICQKYPDLHSTIFDVSDTLAVTKEMIKGFPEKKRITLKEGDFLKDPMGKNLDVILMSDVIYEKVDAGIALKNAWDSLGSGGLLIIRGYYSDPEGLKPLFGALFAVKGLVDTADRKMMTIKDVEKVVRAAGFKIKRVSPLTEHSFLVIGKKT